MQGQRHPRPCPPGAGQGSGRSAGSPQVCSGAPPSAPSVQASGAGKPCGIFTAGRLLRSRCPNTMESWSQCGKLFSLGKDSRKVVGRLFLTSRKPEGVSLGIKDCSKAHKSSQFHSALLEQQDPSQGSNHQARANSKLARNLNKGGKAPPSPGNGSWTNPVPFSDCHQSFRRFGANVVTTFSMR